MDENKIETLGQLTEISMSEDHQADNESISSNEDKQDGASSVNEVDSNENQSDEQSNESNESLEDDLSKRIDEAFNAITEGNEKQQDSAKPEANQQPADASASKQPKTSESGQEKLEDDKPKTEAEEEAEILAMAGNERSRKRFEKILHERKEAREIANSFVDQIKGAGYDVKTEAVSILDSFVSRFGEGKLLGMHLNDSKVPLSSHKDRHESIGLGLIGKEAFCEIVRHKATENIPLILETPDEERWPDEVKELLRASEL